MTSEARVTANRRNAEKSTGPRTAEGKAVVAQNAVKHGLWARQAVLKDEDPQEFDLHRQRMLDGLAPDGPDQEAMAERIVALWWRLKRAERMQDEALDYLIEADRGDDWVKHLRSEGDPSAKAELRFGRAVARDFANARTLDRLSMHERRIEGSLYRTMNELRRLQLKRKADGGQCPPDKSEPARDESDYAKQSQSQEVSSLKCEGSSSTPAPGGDPSRGRLGHMVADPVCETKPMEAGGAACSVPARALEETPCGVTTNQAGSLKEEGGQCPRHEIDYAKQSQSGEVSSLKCEGSSSTPAPGGDPSRGRLGYMVADPACETKPMEAGGTACSMPVTLNHGRDAHATQTPHGVTTSGVDSAEQSQFAAQEAGHSPPYETDSAKQSQCPGPGAGVRAVLRARPRVAWHYHNT